MQVGNLLNITIKMHSEVWYLAYLGGRESADISHVSVSTKFPQFRYVSANSLRGPKSFSDDLIATRPLICSILLGMKK